MNFRTKHIPVRLTGMAVGVYTFDFRVAPHDLEMPESFEQPIVVHVQLDASHAQVLLTVDVETEATMPCDRCLDPVSVPVRTRFRLLYRHDEEVPVRDDDEDGVVFLDFLVVGETTHLIVTSTCEPEFGACTPHLDAWIDFDANGDWEGTGEQVFTATALAEGSNPMSFEVPANGVLGPTYARFRLSESGGLPATGPATSGEVEDYAIRIFQAIFRDGFESGDSLAWSVTVP